MTTDDALVISITEGAEAARASDNADVMGKLKSGSI